MSGQNSDETFRTASPPGVLVPSRKPCPTVFRTSGYQRLEKRPHTRSRCGSRQPVAATVGAPHDCSYHGVSELRPEADALHADIARVFVQRRVRTETDSLPNSTRADRGTQAPAVSGNSMPPLPRCIQSLQDACICSESKKRSGTQSLGGVVVSLRVEVQRVDLRRQLRMRG
jgi:hypothetical protein